MLAAVVKEPGVSSEPSSGCVIDIDARLNYRRIESKLEVRKSCRMAARFILHLELQRPWASRGIEALKHFNPESSTANEILILDNSATL